MVRIASFNVENLFDRARLLAADDWATHRSLLDTYAKLTRTLQRAAYSATDKANIVKWLVALGLEKADSGTYVILRQNRGRLISAPPPVAWSWWRTVAPTGSGGSSSRPRP